MSDSSSSDEEASRFREACDPTLWRTATQETSKTETCQVELSDDGPHHHSSDGREAFVLLEKLQRSLAEAHGRTGNVWPRYKDDHGLSTQARQAGRAEASTAREAVSAPSTLSPFLAKQLTARLDGSVEYQHSQEPRLTRGGGGGGSGGQSLQKPLQLLNNLPLTPQAGTDPTHTAARRRRAARLPKRLTYFDGCDEEKLKAQCRSVAVPSHWILSGEAAYPRPHPKNVRYLQKYKLKERKADGSIVAVPCSLPDDATTTTNNNNTAAKTRKKKKQKEGLVRVSGEGDRAALQQEEMLTGLCNGSVSESVEKSRKSEVCVSQAGKEKSLNGLMSCNVGLDSNTRKQRKQNRKRGKKKKFKGSNEMGAL